MRQPTIEVMLGLGVEVNKLRSRASFCDTCGLNLGLNTNQHVTSVIDIFICSSVK